MVKHTQTIRWQQPTNFLSLLDHFVGLALRIFTDKIHHRSLTGTFQEASQEPPWIFDFHQIFDIDIFHFWLNIVFYVVKDIFLILYYNSELLTRKPVNLTL